MQYLLKLTDLSLERGNTLLLDKVNFQLAAKERVCLIGRNGVGKSSLLQVIQAKLNCDSGNIEYKPGLRIGSLNQQFSQNLTGTVFEFVAESLAEIGKILAQYHQITAQLEKQSSPKLLQQLEQLQQKIDANNAWDLDRQIMTILSKLNIEPNLAMNTLSGGWQRRVALAKAFVGSPDILLLDEPTNHLDIETIQWLEDQLLASNQAIIFITHDRSLLQHLATRIIELDRGQLRSWPGDYDNYLKQKTSLLQAETKANAEFDKKLAQEEKWIRQGIKARRTRNEGRVRTLKKMRQQVADRLIVQGKANIKSSTAKQSGKSVIEVENISHSYDNKILIDNFSINIQRGDRIGLIGPNGVGKSTLLNILLGKMTPQRGTVKHGTKLEIAYFDQQREKLSLEKTVAENIADGCTYIEINEQKRHVIGYLEDFLFTSQRARTPVKALSGGERTRLMLARVFSRASNLLVLDEPTNDLDIETLELLEDVLMDYQGTLLLVSHDRFFLDQVVTSTLVFDGNTHIEAYVGGYQDYLTQRPAISPPTKQTNKPKVEHPIKAKNKLNYKQSQELKQLPKLIEQLEIEQNEIQTLISSENFYQQNTEKFISQTMQRIAEIETQLEAAYQRWDELEKSN